MPRSRVRLEISEPDALVLGLQLEVQLPVLITGGHAKPVLLIVAGHGLVTVPGAVVSRLPGIGQAEAITLARLQTIDLKVKPLEMVAVEVRAHGQQYALRVAGVDDLNVATVEIRTDLHDCLVSEISAQDCSS